jgi:AcrR family transcriptional regulator
MQDTPGWRRRHEQILAAAVRLFIRDGFEATTMDAIAAEAGVSRATVFNHVAGKRDLLAGLYDRQLRRLAEQTLHRPTSGSLTTQIGWFFETAEHVLREDGALTPLLIREVLHDAVLLDRDMSHGLSARATLEAVVRDAQAAGRLRRSIPASTITGLFMDCWTATLIPWGATGARSPLAAAVMAKIRLMLRGLATPRTRSQTGSPT